MTYDWNKHAPQPWRSVVTPLALPILVHRAKTRRTITYGELGEEIYRRFGEVPTKRKTLYGQPVGAIGLAIEDLAKATGEQIPPLNALVVNATTQLPGDGVNQFVEHFLGKSLRNKLSNQDRRDLMRYTMERVWDYSRWDWVAANLGAEPLQVADLGESGPLDLPPIERPMGGESKEHKALKHWVCQHPEIFSEYGTFGPGEPEHCLRSGDSLDAYFHAGTASLAVEVKASQAREAELVRGVFQVVKYRAVLKAEQIAIGKVPNAQAILVTTQPLPKIARQLAERLMVEHRIVDLAAEQTGHAKK